MLLSPKRWGGLGCQSPRLDAPLLALPGHHCWPYSWQALTNVTPLSPHFCVPSPNIYTYVNI